FHDMFFSARNQAKMSRRSDFRPMAGNSPRKHGVESHDFVRLRTDPRICVALPYLAQWQAHVPSSGIPPSLMASAATRPRPRRRGLFYAEQAGLSYVCESASGGIRYGHDLAR